MSNTRTAGPKLRVFRIHWQTLTVLIRNWLPILACTTFVQGGWHILARGTTPQPLDLIQLMAISLGLQMFLINLILYDLNGNTLSLRDAYERALKALFLRNIDLLRLPILLATLLLSLVLVLNLQLIGFLPLADVETSTLGLVQGLGVLITWIVGPRLVLVMPIAVVERNGILRTFKRSLDLTRGKWFRIAGVFLVLGVVLGPTFTALVLWLDAFDSRTGEIDMELIPIWFSLPFDAVVSAYSAVLAVVLYYNLRPGTSAP